jgi:hypothetical protein
MSSTEFIYEPFQSAKSTTPFYYFLPYKRIKGKLRVALTHSRHVRWVHTGGTFKRG